MAHWYTANLPLVHSTLVAVLVGMSVQLPFRNGTMSFAGIGFYGVGGYAAAIMVHRGHGAAIGVVVAVGIALVGSWCLSFALTNLRGLQFAMATLAFDLVLIVLARNGGGLTGGATGLFAIEQVTKTWHILLAIAVFAVIVAQFERRSWGRASEGIRLDDKLAASLGIDVVRQRRHAFVLSAVIGAVAGVLNVLSIGSIAPPDAGFNLVVLGLTIAVIGGLDTWLGAVVGALVLNGIPQLFSGLGAWRSVVFGFVVVIFVVWASDGIVGRARALWRHVSHHAEPAVLAANVEGVSP